MNNKKDVFLEKTICVWQRKYKEPLISEDAREIIRNLTGFFKMLAKWQEEGQIAEGDYPEKEGEEDGKEKIYFRE